MMLVIPVLQEAGFRGDLLPAVLTLYDVSSQLLHWRKVNTLDNADLFVNHLEMPHSRHLRRN